MPRTTNARAKAIATAERLFRTQGYAATGLAQIIEESGAPKGSFYFHFPGGKRELALEAIGAYRATTSKAFRAMATAAEGDPGRLVRGLSRAVAREMAGSDWVLGCVAQVLAQELAPQDAEAAAALVALFDEWTGIIAEALGGDRDRALALVAALEGARTLARAARSPAPFDAVSRQFAGA